MKILVLHSDIGADPPPEEQDTLLAADAVQAALAGRGHTAAKAAFREESLASLLRATAPDMVFNLVEGVDGKGILASIAPRLLAELEMPFTGSGAKAMDVTCDKPLSKRMLRQAGSCDTRLERAAGLAGTGWPPLYRQGGAGRRLHRAGRRLRGAGGRM